MYTGYSNGVKRNDFITPPTYALTQSLINDALNDLNLEDNGNNLFQLVDTPDGQAIAPISDVPMQASNFKITSTDEQITADNTNACSVGVVRDFINDIDTRLLENYMTETECDSKYLVKNGWVEGHYSDPATSGYSVAEVDSALSSKANASDVYTKAQVDSSLSTKANSADVYTKAQVDEAITNIDAVSEQELNAKLETYATKDWVEAAISSGSDVGPMVASQTGSYESLTQYSYVDFTQTPTTSTPMHLFDSFARNHYNEGYKSSYYLQSAKFDIKGYNSETGQYDQYVDWDYVMKELECRMVVYKSIHYYDEEEEEEEHEEITEDIGLMVLFYDDSTYKFYAKGICQTVDDPESYYIHLQFARKSTATHIPDKLEIKWTFDSETSMIENPYVRVIKENNNDGYVTEQKLDEVQTNIANTYLTKSNAQTTYATKTYVDTSIANIPDQGIVTLNMPIETQSLSVTIPNGATDAHTTDPLLEIPTDDSKTKNIKVTLDCTIASNSTDISHNLDDYTFQLKDQTGHLCCTLNSIYATENSTDYTKLEGQFSGTFTTSNNRISLYITRVASTPAESIVMTAIDTNIGTASFVIGGYITKAYADEHYASRDTPTVMNITNYDDSTHTTNKTTYDFGPDFTIEFGLDIALKVTFKTGSPAVQMASAAICTLLQFGLDKLTGGSLTASNDAYQMDIHNVIGTSQLAALTDFNSWVSNYSRYSGTTLNNFLITAAAAEQRYLKSADMSNYYTKTESDARFINVDEPVELLARTFNITLTNINDFLVTGSRLLTNSHSFTAESSSISFEYRNVAAWTHQTRYPASMETVSAQIVARITGKTDQEFNCTFSEYYTGILDDAHYHLRECDKFFDIFCNGTINCDAGDTVTIYIGFKDTAVTSSSNSDVGCFEPAQDGGHTKYFKGVSTTSIDSYYNKAESDDRYYTKTDADAKFVQIAPSSIPMTITSDTYSDAAYAKNSTSYAKIPLSVLTPADSGSLAIDFNIKVAISDTKDDGTYTSEYNDYTYGIYLKRYYSASAYNEYYYKDVLKPTYNSTTNILTLIGRFNCDVISACLVYPYIAITNKDPSTGSSDTRWFTVTSGTITANLLPTTSLSHHSIARYNIADSTWTPTYNGATDFIYEINLDADSTYMFDFNFRKIIIQQIDGVDYDATDDTQYGHRDIARDLRWRMCFSINNVWVYDTAACYVTRLNAGEVSMSGHFMYHSESACKAGFKIAMKYDGLYTGTAKTIKFSIAGTCSQPNFVQITKL